MFCELFKIRAVFAAKCRYTHENNFFLPMQFCLFLEAAHGLPGHLQQVWQEPWLLCNVSKPKNPTKKKNSKNPDKKYT